MPGRKCILRVVVIAIVCSVAQPVLDAQTAPGSPEQTKPQEHNGPEGSGASRDPAPPINITLVGIVDGGGQDRYGVVVLRRGDWLLEEINWADRSGADAVSLLLAGRRLQLGHGLNKSILAGPWYEYANRAWDEAVIDTNFQFHAERFLVISINHWGIPLKATGEVFDAHMGTVTGIPRLPLWLGANAEIERKSAGVTTLWAGPLLTKQRSNLSLGGVPYWDFLRHTAGFRLTVSYQTTLKTSRDRVAK